MGALTRTEEIRPMPRKNQKGFTLMELMVVIVIVAILAAVAVPLYLNYVKDAQRTEAKGAIGAIITAEQTYFQQNNTYVDVPAFVVNPKPGDQVLNCDLTEALHNWNFVVSGSSAQGYIVTATENGTNQSLKDIGTITYTYDRVKGATWTPQ
jgi:type IV pilus assembly protein PilE